MGVVEISAIERMMRELHPLIEQMSFFFKKNGNLSLVSSPISLSSAVPFFVFRRA